MKFSIGRPKEGHSATVGRTRTGMSPTLPSRPYYGTTLSCSCGELRSQKVSNSAPSSGGRVDAQDAYRRHLADVEAREKS